MTKSYNFMNKLNQGIFALGAIALVGGVASQAKADISYTVSDASLEYVSVQFQGTTYGSVLAGGIGITASGPTGGAPSSYVSVCTDFLGSLYIGNTYTFASPIPTANALTTPGYNPDPSWGQVAPAAIQNAATLFANYHSALTSGNYDAAAGLQLAIWTVLYDSTGVGSVNAGSGAEFQAISTAMDSGAISQETSFLSALGSLAPSPDVKIFVPTPDSASNGNNPDGNPPQGLLLYAPVPEASTVITATLLLLSFGMCSLKSFGKFRA
jgi:hypothetical protein